MTKRNLIIIFIIVIIGAGAIGYTLGNILIPPRADIDNVSRFINSKLTKDFNATLLGKIVSISDTSLVIEADGENLFLTLPRDTGVLKQGKIVSGSSIPEPPEVMKLSDLKAGDSVSVFVLLGADGVIAALDIMLLP